MIEGLQCDKPLPCRVYSQDWLMRAPHGSPTEQPKEPFFKREDPRI